MKVHQQYHFRKSEKGLLAWDVLILMELFREFTVIQVPLTEIAELNEAYWFGLGAAPTSVDIAEHARQIYEADIS